MLAPTAAHIHYANLLRDLCSRRVNMQLSCDGEGGDRLACDRGPTSGPEAPRVSFYAGASRRNRGATSTEISSGARASVAQRTGDSRAAVARDSNRRNTTAVTGARLVSESDTIHHPCNATTAAPDLGSAARAPPNPGGSAPAHACARKIALKWP